MNLSFLQLLALAGLFSGMGLAVIRLLLGPTAADRVVATDTLAVITTAGLVGLAGWLNSSLYLDVALVYGTLAFVGTVAMARAIEGDKS